LGIDWSLVLGHWGFTAACSLAILFSSFRVLRRVWVDGDAFLGGKGSAGDAAVGGLGAERWFVGETRGGLGDAFCHRGQGFEQFLHSAAEEGPAVDATAVVGGHVESVADVSRDAARGIGQNTFVTSMRAYLPHILALLIAAAGWFYMFYSQAATRLAAFESKAANRKRVMLRRLGGGLMFLLAVMIFAGLETIDPKQSPNAFVGVWAGVVVVMFAILVLALVDVRLTGDLRRRDKDDSK
jgi:hypothetical protein